MKLAITHSKKVPGPADYSSEGFSATIEVEVPDETARDSKTLHSYFAELYSEAKQAVEEQIRSVPPRNGGQNGGHNASGIFGRSQQPGGATHDEARPVSDGNGSRAATPKQVAFLVSLGAKQRLTFADLQRIAQERFRVADLYQLDRQAASQLIDELRPQDTRRA